MFTLSEKKVGAMAEVSRDIGQVFFASVLIEPIVSGKTDSTMFFFGILSSIVFLGLSIMLQDIKTNK